MTDKNPNILNSNQQALLEKLFANNNKVLTFLQEDTNYASRLIKTDKIAVFEDGSVVISKDHKFEGTVMNTKAMVKRAGGVLKEPIYEDISFIAEIYEYGKTHNQQITDIKVKEASDDDYKEHATRLMADKTLISTYMGQSFIGIFDEEWQEKVEKKNADLNKVGKYLEFPNSKIRIHKGYLAIFSDGSVYCADFIKHIEDIIKAQAKLMGIDVKEVIYARMNLIDWIYSHARQMFKNKMVERTIKPQDEYVKELISQSIMLNNQDVMPEIKNKFAIFENGRVIISNDRTRGQIMAMRNYISDVIKTALADEVVPQSYLDEIHQKAKVAPLAREKTTQEIVEELFDNNNKCVTFADTRLSITDRDKVAIFSDGTVVINYAQKDHHQSRYLKGRYKELGLKKDMLVSKEVMEAIYQKAAELQKGFKDIAIEKLKKFSKQIAKNKNIALHEAQDIVAKSYGFNHWKNATMTSEEFACFLLKDIEFDERDGIEHRIK